MTSCPHPGGQDAEVLKDTVNGNGTSPGEAASHVCTVEAAIEKSRSSLLYLLEKRDRDYDILRLPIMQLTLIPLDLLSH